MRSSTAGPGWFPDPGDPSLLRYWDGSSWTEHTAPVQPPAAQDAMAAAAAAELALAAAEADAGRFSPSSSFSESLLRAMRNDSRGVGSRPV